MGANKLTFQVVPESNKNVRVLGSLVFDKRSELGPGAYIDLSGFSTHLLLVRDCIAALNQHSSPGRIASDQTIPPYKTSIRKLVDFCCLKGVPNNFRMKDITFEFMLDYRAHLRLLLSEYKSGVRRKRFGHILILLEAGQAVGLAHPDFVSPRNFEFGHDGDRTQPYTAEEALDFEDACRTHIRELLARLEEGKRLVLLGKDPRGAQAPRDPLTGRIRWAADCERAWNQLPNLLWYVINVMDGKYLQRSGLYAGGHYMFNNSMQGVANSVYRKGDVYSHLYPLMDDLIPFIVLLAKKTGRNESSILNLKRDCLQEINGRTFLWYQKPRGGARLYKKPVDNDGPFSPVALITTLKQITEPLVRFAPPQDREKLIIGLTICASGGEPVKSLNPSHIKYRMNREGGWCDQRELVDANERPLRVSLKRWRVTYLSNRYKRTGQLGKVSRDAAHAVEDTTVGYVANESTKHLHEKAVADGIQSLRSLARPKVLVQDTPQAAANVLGKDVATVGKILRGEQDVLFASCKDFYNRPGGLPNTPCDRPWGCFFCSNAIITRHVLPRVLAFRNFMLEEQGERITDDWVAKFGEIWHVLTHEILPKFSAEAIAEAERLAHDEILYIPLAMRS